jgi:hypothetical protein
VEIEAIEPFSVQVLAMEEGFAGERAGSVDSSGISWRVAQNQSFGFCFPKFYFIFVIFGS